MKIISMVSAMQSLAIQTRQKCRCIGFVPTMGFLHEGHMSLVRIARNKSDIVVLSSFVNPVQFGPNEDFDKYPRDETKDDMLCEREGVDIVFRPSADDIYTNDHSVYVEEEKLSTGLCGKFRPGHFQGVLTIVAKLFNIVQPHVAVFGGKDAQQARVIEQMVRDLNFPVEIIIGPIIREPDGLAMSSRNTYLSQDERKRAVNIYVSLCHARRLYEQGVRNTSVLRGKIREIIETDVQPSEIEYIEAVDYTTLQPVTIVQNITLVAVAVKVGRTRLIDNILIP
ncbi:MAG: pantoate--beta-alanine ligase [Kiritimatiellae bacterium]|nr:pantoate--beta-alanine ligase [Kiritimatiellia bacterium]MDD5522872.1 pantoate--beta-alanine ligase [Kiritimatiellia bacterium]